MIPVSELRSNVSIVLLNSSVTTVENMHIYRGDYVQFNPIPLSTALLKAMQMPKFKNFAVKKMHIGELAFGLYYQNDWTGAYVKYLHELQNTYHSLTRDELKVDRQTLKVFFEL